MLQANGGGGVDEAPGSAGRAGGHGGALPAARDGLAATTAPRSLSPLPPPHLSNAPAPTAQVILKTWSCIGASWNGWCEVGITLILPYSRSQHYQTSEVTLYLDIGSQGLMIGGFGPGFSPFASRILDSWEEGG